MPVSISREKLQELIRLADRASQEPAGLASDPARGGPGGREGADVPAPPLQPQPAPDWRSAFEKYVAELPDAAHDEIISLYHLGGGELGQPPYVASSRSLGDAPDLDRVAFIVSRSDLSLRLKHALEQL